jgi:hypothetical protein
VNGERNRKKGEEERRVEKKNGDFKQVREDAANRGE